MTPTTPTTPTTPAPFRTLAARFPGTCRRCNGPITVGQTIRYGGKGRCYHLAADCPKGPGYTDDPPFAHLGNYADPDLTEPTYPRLPELAPRAAGEAAEAYGLRALLFITAERLTCTVDLEGLQLAQHVFRLAVCNPALTSTGAERLADVGRMITRALATHPEAAPAAEAPAGDASGPAGEDTPRQGPGAPLAPAPRPQAPPAMAAPVAPALVLAPNSHAGAVARRAARLAGGPVAPPVLQPVAPLAPQAAEDLF